MKEIEDSPLMREVNNITTNNANPVHFAYYVQIHVGKLTYTPLKILSIDISQDFESNYADEIQVTLAISGGMYAFDIYPYKDKIDITLIRLPIGEVSTSNDTSTNRQTERYTATLIDTGNPAIEGNGNNTPTKETLNLTSITEVTFQLVNKAVEQFRLISVGGIYRVTTAAAVLQSVMTNETKKISVPGTRMPAGVDMVSNTNPAIREHVILPHGIKLIDVPNYLHEMCGGIYPSGFGYYMQKDHWFVYPCYDTTRYNSSKRQLTIINVPKNKFPSIERTYRKDGKSLVILATGNVKFRDNTEVMQLNAGNGVMFADANKFMTGFGKVENNKCSVSRGTNNTEVVATQRANGINNVRLSTNAINANPYLEYSRLAARSCSVLSMEWENSDNSLIDPGTMVKMLYMDNDKIGIIYGCVLRAHTFISLQEQGMMSTRMVSRTVITVVVKPIKQ
jgi:hypothetical protein